MLKQRGMRFIRCINWWHIGKTWLLIGFLLFFCEVLIYYIVLLQCTWPQIETNTRHSTVKAALLADTHLLGPRFGHWFDKLRREWQMYRTFQTTMTLHNPQVVFILGDIFDEGYHCSEEEFNNYVKRFHSLFSVPENTKLYVVIGNHDIGFHYRVSRRLKERFEKSFNVSAVEMLTINGNIFVLVNSMALQGDNCFLCKPAEEKLKEIHEKLRCAKIHPDEEKCKNYSSLPPYSPPIFLQHFPLYRSSDAHCLEPDAAPPEIINEPFRETWECLSKQSTNKILDLLEPRVAFSGHTHHGCFTLHRERIPEWTIPSFSWRNKNDPSFILATFAPDAYMVTKCYMPKESTIVNFYTLGCTAILIWMYFTRYRFFRGAYYKEK
ncbi:metallophosphoesterase 1-like isoform X2 [Stegodyphus dumicola]|nr:metallophosphoesterase 1-like isoform X2 [Stegodyphus dumicola]XP_035227273.1 metallophosphoesterase 1-like isoform X2 [Stegodyphus dumicola]